MNIYEKALDGNDAAFRAYDCAARKTPEYVTVKQAEEMLADARKQMDDAIAAHSYARAHNALWAVLCCQSRLDAARFPKT